MRGFLGKALWVLLLAAGLTTLAIGHRDLWRLFLPRDRAVEVNLRLLLPLVTMITAGAGLALLHSDRVVGWFASKRAARAAVLGLEVACCLGLALTLNLISARRFTRVDLTAARLASVGSRTRAILARLRTPVEIDVFLDPGEAWYPAIEGLLESYRAVAGRQLALRYLRPGRDDARFAARVRQVGLDPTAISDPRAILVSARPHATGAPRRRLVTLDALVAHRAGAATRESAVRFRGEEALTRAILAVTAPRPVRVCFLWGHGELVLRGRRRDRTCRQLVAGLESLDYSIEPLQLAAAAQAGSEAASAADAAEVEVPARCDVLVIAGPESALSAPEQAAIARWLSAGGRLLLLAEPAPVAPKPTLDPKVAAPFLDTGMRAIVEPFGVELEPWVLRVPARRVAGLGAFGLELPFGGADHPVTRPLVAAGRTLLLERARPLRIARPPAGRATPTPLVVVRGDLRRKGLGPEHPAASPQVLAVAVQRRARADGGEARLVVVGDASLASDLLAGPGGRQANLSFLENAVSWLAGREESISIAPKPPHRIRFQLSPDDWRRLWLLAILELPLVCGAIALWVYVARRR